MSLKQKFKKNLTEKRRRRCSQTTRYAKRSNL